MDCYLIRFEGTRIHVSGINATLIMFAIVFLK